MQGHNETQHSVWCIIEKDHLKIYYDEEGSKESPRIKEVSKEMIENKKEYLVELRKLEDMGYTDKEANLAVLNMYNGDVDQVVHQYLNDDRQSK